MRRGTRVGQAYVSVTADGDGINEGIVKSVDEAGPDIDRAGDEHGERYGDHFSEGFFHRLRKRFSKDIEKHLGSASEDAGDDAGDRMGSALVQRLRERLRGADDLVERLGEGMERALNGRTTTKKLDAMAHSLRTAENSAARLERELRTVMKAEGLLGDVVSRNRGRDNGLTGIDDWLSKSRFRNNALNILAKGMGGIIHGFERIAILSRNFVSNMQNAEEGASIFAKIGAGFGGGGAEGVSLFSKIAASGPGAVVAIAGVAAGASFLVTVLSGLLAIVVALVATMTSALTGALLVGGAAFGAVTTAVGLTVLAFKSMTDAQKKVLSQAFRPLHAEAVGLGQVMLRQMIPAFSQWSKNLQTALAFAQPLAAVMGGAFADAGNILTKSLSGPGIRQFLDSLTVNLPSIVKNLSRALGGFLNGMGSLFAALMPDVREFAHWLAGIARDFANWAASPAGQNAIVDFVDRALDSLHSLNAFIGAVGGLLAKLLFSTQSQQAGNSIFDDMTQGIRNFTAYLTPERLQNWFDQGKTLAKGLGDSIRAVAVLMASLNDAGVLDGIASIAHLVEQAVTAFQKLPAPIKQSLKVFTTMEMVAKASAAAVIGALALIVAAFGLLLRAAAKSVEALSHIPVIGDKFKGMAKSVSNAADNVQGLATKLGKMPRNILLSINADTDPAVTALNRLVSQTRALHINIPVTVSTNANVAEAAALSSTHPTTSGTSGSIDSLVNTGTDALAGTNLPKAPKKFHNPWKKWALSLIKEGPSISAQIRNAILSINKQAAAGIRAAARASSAGDVQSALQTLSDSITTSAQQTVNSARQALNSAATDLANATSRAAAKRALAAVKTAQKNLAAAKANAARVAAANKIINAQRVLSSANVTRLIAGVAVQNATLADYAEARARVATMLDTANTRLAEAISLRDDYKKAVADSIKEFGSLLTAQAQSIDGVEQALTANDITSNLQTRLDQIKKFQDDLRLLLAQGLSNDAYKQIVDAGVEQGTTIADALLAGGTGAIQNVNSLVGQINGIADTLGTETSSRMYQAGVDAAQGLVDGLTSLAAQLDAAAVRLGDSIALAIQRALGIASPSQRLIDMMDYVGDGAAIGLDNQHVKVGSAAARLADRIGITPGGTYSSTPGGADVSGNQPDPRFRDLVVHTPTEDPKAVALEVLNEVTGRI